MNLNLDQQGLRSPMAKLQRLGPLGDASVQAVVLGMHRSGTSALTSLLDRLGFYAGPDESLMPANDYNPEGYWEHNELHAINEEMLASVGGSWVDVLKADPRRFSHAVRARFLPRAQTLVRELDSFGPWVIKDPRLCVLLPFWRDLLRSPLCVLIYRDPLAVARSLARRDELPTHVGIALWEHYNLSALAASQGLPRALVGYHELVADPAGVASRLVQDLADSGVRGLGRLRELSAADARILVDGSLDHHAAAPDEHSGYLNASQRELLRSFESGEALKNPVPSLSAGAYEILTEHSRQTRMLAQIAVDRETAARETRLAERLQHIESLIAGRDAAVVALEQRLARSEQECRNLSVELRARQELLFAAQNRLTCAEQQCGDLTAALHLKQRAVAEREALLASVFASRSWRVGFSLKRLLGIFQARQEPTALDRWQSLQDG